METAMDGDTVWLTADGLEKLKAEFDKLKTVDRPEIVKAIATARAHGDVTDNAEYRAAKEQHGLIEARIAGLEDKIARARLIGEEDVPADKVYLGASVRLEDLKKGRTVEYTIVDAAEADFKARKISASSPVAQALLGKTVGDVVTANVPAGELKYKIIGIMR